MCVSAFRRTALAAALAGALVMAPRLAHAQGLFYEQIAISAATVYNGNIFASSSGTVEDDLVLRVGPAVTVGYRSTPFAIAAKYTMQAERFLTHSNLNRLLAYQDAGMTMDWHPTRRLSFDERADFISTHTPTELNTLTFITVGRAPAHRFIGESGVTYKLTELSTVKGRADYAHEAFATLSTDTWGAHGSYGHKMGRRNEYRVGYDARFIDSAGVGAGAREASQAVTFGWSSDITRSLHVDADAGPRFGDGIRPELSFGVHHTMRHATQTFTFAETRTTTIGQPGALDVRRAVADASWQALRRVNLGAALDLARSSSSIPAVGTISVAAVQLRATIQATRRLGVVVSGEAGRQENRTATERFTVPLRIITCALTLTLPEQTNKGKGR